MAITSQLLTSVCLTLTTVTLLVTAQDPMVLTSQGVVRGSWSGDGSYSRFMGIPYAIVDPDNPFGNALPGETFEGIFDANDDSAICPQIEEFNNTVTGNLDCLHINVYVPRSASASKPLPVLVWIYGGGFKIGFAGQYVYGPQYLVRHEVILVTLNYRIGPYGFMCLDTEAVSGNTGLKDIRQGLRWIKDNIGAFGGNANKVTLFGQSAGGAAVDFLILSSSSAGLFQQAIMQSGTALLEKIIVDSKPSAPVEIAQYLGYNVENIEDSLDILKNIDTNDIILAGEALKITFRPCVEKVFDGVENIIIDHPDDVLESGNFTNVPLIIGYTDAEKEITTLIGLRDDPDYLENFADDFYNRLNRYFDMDDDKLRELTKIVRNFYMGTNELNKNSSDGYIQFDNDAQYFSPIERSVSKYRAKSNKPIYQYVFAYTGEINFVKRRHNITEGGAAHADDVGYFFKQIYLPEENSPEDQLIVDQMTTMWANFAKYGDPTPEASDLLPVRWPAVTDDREFLWIDSDLQIDRKPFHARIAFWDLMFKIHGKKFRKSWKS